MKRTFTIFAVVITAALTGQNSFQLLDHDNNNALIPANSVIYHSVDASDTHKANIDIQNTSGSAQTYGVRRFDVYLNTSGTSTAEAFFCFGGDCYTPGVMDSQNPITLQPNEKSSELPGTFQMLLAELTEISVKGLSHVKYTFYNVNTPGDSIQFSFKYNDPTVGLRSIGAVKPGLSLAPNPAKGNTNAIVTSNVAGNCVITVYNALGAMVANSDTTIGAGTNTIQLKTEDLKKGIYFVSLSVADQTSVQRLIVE